MHYKKEAAFVNL